jgi:hypothetical protein
VGFSRDTISLRKDYKKKEMDKTKEKSNQLSVTKANLDAFLLETDFLRSDKLDFKKPKLYDYKYEGTTYTNENEYACIEF